MGVRSHERARRRPPTATALAHARPASSGRRWYQPHAQATARGMMKVAVLSVTTRRSEAAVADSSGKERLLSGAGERVGNVPRSGRLLSPPVVRIALRLAAHVGLPPCCIGRWGFHSFLGRTVGRTRTWVGKLVLGGGGRSPRTAPWCMDDSHTLLGSLLEIEALFPMKTRSWKAKQRELSKRSQKIHESEGVVSKTR